MIFEEAQYILGYKGSGIMKLLWNIEKFIMWTQCNAKCKQIFAWWKGLAGQHLAGLSFYLSFQGLIQSDSIGLLNKNYSG